MSLNQEIIAREEITTSGFYPKRECAISRGQGCYLYDADGREYLDMAAGHGVAMLGHGNREIATTMAAQAANLITLPETFYNQQRAQLSERLLEILSVNMNRLYYCNSGTESVEAALKIARLATGRKEVVATMRGFHGRTLGALSATWEPKYRKPFEPLIDGFTHIPYNNSEKLRDAVSQSTAAVIIELVQGEGGVRPAAAEFVATAREVCSQHGALLIVDEVQTGFGRTGKWFASHHYGLEPDLICMGKGIAAGMPMGAVAISAIIPSLPKGAHGSTFGGNPLVCAVALKNLEILEKEGLIKNSASMGEKLKNAITGLQHPAVREIRGLGLMLGIELKFRVTPVLKTLMERGVIALPAGNTVLRLLPPLIIDNYQIKTAVEQISTALDQLLEKS